MKRFVLALVAFIVCTSGQASEAAPYYLDRATGTIYFVDQTTLNQLTFASPGWDRPYLLSRGIHWIYPGAAVVSGTVLADWDTETRATPIERRFLVLIPDAASKARNPNLGNSVILQPISHAPSGPFLRLNLPVKPDAENSQFCTYATEGTFLLGNYIKATERSRREDEPLSMAVVYEVLAARTRIKKFLCKS